MKILRRLAVAAALLLALLPLPGRAQVDFGTIAGVRVVCTSCPTEIQEALRFGKELAEQAKQLQELQAIYFQANATYQAFTHITDLGSAVGALQMVGISNPLPVNPYAAQALMGGYGGTAGMLGSIGTLFNTGSTNNSVYTCQGSWICNAMSRFSNGANGTQALSMQLYQSAAERATQLAALQAQLPAARTPAEREALLNQIAAVQAQIANQQVQATAINTYGVQQVALQQQQQQERMQQSMDVVLQEARVRGYVN